MTNRQLSAQPTQANGPPPAAQGQSCVDLQTLLALGVKHGKARALPLEPGSLTIRPTRKDAERNPHDFYVLLESLRHANVLPYKKIATAIGDNTPSYQSNISRKLRERAFSGDQRQKILRAIFEDQMTACGHARAELKSCPDAFYFSLLDFMSVQETSQDNARAVSIGTYKFWRHSFDHEGEFVFGRVDIFEDASSHALKVVMNQHKKAHAGIPGAHERFEGYFFRLADSYIMVLHDPENEDIRLTHFTSYKIDAVGAADPAKPSSVFAGLRNHLVYLRGFVSGTDGNRGLFSPVEMVLVEDVEELKELDSQLDVIGPGHALLPPRVESFLNQQGKMRRF